MIALAPYIEGGLWEQLAEALGDPTSLESRAIAATSPLFPRRLGTYAGGTKSGLMAVITRIEPAAGTRIAGTSPPSPMRDAPTQSNRLDGEIEARLD